jgi:hypothetical protein
LHIINNKQKQKNSMVFSLGLGVIYLFNLYSTVPSYFGYLKKISPQALTALPRRAASGSELPHVVIFRLFPSRHSLLSAGVVMIKNPVSDSCIPVRANSGEG